MQKIASINSLKDISILEIDELYTYKKDQRTVKFVLIWIAVDRQSGEVIDFEIIDRSKKTYLRLMLRLKKLIRSD